MSDSSQLLAGLGSRPTGRCDRAGTTTTSAARPGGVWGRPRTASAATARARESVSAPSPLLGAEVGLVRRRQGGSRWMCETAALRVTP
jgi:hypothetical protein